MGRVLLAAEETAALDALYRDAPPRGITLAQVMRRARADRARGLVVHLGEFEAGIASVAAPLRDAAGRVVAAINLSAPVAEAPEAQQRTVRDAVLQAAATISGSLGWTG
jgi:DNA-binding IclR family transcriptional regulator